MAPCQRVWVHFYFIIFEWGVRFGNTVLFFFQRLLISIVDVGASDIDNFDQNNFSLRDNWNIGNVKNHDKVWIERSLNLKFWSRWRQSRNPISPITPFSFIRTGFRSFWFIGGCPQGSPDIPVSRIRRSKPTCCSRISRLWSVEEKTGKSSPWTGNCSLFNHYLNKFTLVLDFITRVGRLMARMLNLTLGGHCLALGVLFFIRVVPMFLSLNVVVF